MWHRNRPVHLNLKAMATQLTAFVPKLYIGMDIHKKSWSVHLRTDLFDHKGFTLPPKPEVLYDYVDRHFREHEVSITYEAGCCGFSAARYFLNLGWGVTVVNTGDVPRMNKQHYQKTDKIDSRNLCKQLQTGNLQAIHIPTTTEEQLRGLMRQRDSVSRQLCKTKNRIKSTLLYHGVSLPEEFDRPTWTISFLEWISKITWEENSGKLCMESMLRVYAAFKKEYLELANELRSFCRKHNKKDYYLLKSIPGIGGYLASAIIAELGDLRRFGNEKQLGSYIGLVPGMYNSGDSERSQGITPRCKPILRRYLIEASWVAIRRDPEMQAYYRKHFGKNPKAIVVKVAHKLVNRMLSVIKTEKPYEVNRNIA
ncbi:transposase [Pedobacter sp. UYP30]